MRRPVIFVLLAGFAALVAALVVYSALKKREGEVEAAKAQNVEIVVAAKDIGIGSKIAPDSVKQARWSRDSVPPGSFTDPAAVVNQFTKTSFVQGEPIVADRLFAGEKNAGVLPLLIPPGMRALSIPVDEVSDIAGFVLPHTRVDVLVSVASGPSNDNKPFSKIVLQDIEVLAIAQEIENTGDKAQVVKVVTFLVSPQDAERLTLASHEGSIRLAMRNYDDKKIVMTSGVDVAQLLRSFGGPQPPVPLMTPQRIASSGPPRRRIKPVQVEIMRNGKSSENVSFIRAKGSPESMPETMEPQGPSSSANDSPNKVADAGGPARRNTGANSRIAGAAAPAHSLAAVGSSVPAMMSPGAEGFTTPSAKTIDVP